MPPKNGKRRGLTTNGNDVDVLKPPDRATWTGWVETESEPAFFNVMLNQMGVRGVKVQEVVSLDEDMLNHLSHPIHALIFLFRYQDADHDESQSTACPENVWFANQIPDFACATYALLNSVFNIPGLTLGKNLHELKAFTKDMNPISRGDVVDGCEFVRRIHNSFARESDMLQADMSVKKRAEKLKKRQSTLRAREVRDAKKNGTLPSATPERSSTRDRKILKTDPDGDYQAGPKPKPKGSDVECEDTKPAPRRSGRAPQTQKKDKCLETIDADEAEGGFHFMAYMPIDGRVWKLDGLNNFPEDMGAFEGRSEDGKWMSIVKPALEDRMAKFMGAELEFNLMAVVHDSAYTLRQDLLRNIKAIQVMEKRLDNINSDWRSVPAAETPKDVILSQLTELDITQEETDKTALPEDERLRIERADDFSQLISDRRDLIDQQAALRASVKDAAAEVNENEKKARDRSHDYGPFVRSWLEALAEHELLSGLLEDLIT